MVTQLTSTTFLSDYRDDYRDSDHYHRILFNNGRALQARELTQMQTIIQAELNRIAKFIVNEGAIFNNNTSLASGPNSFAFTSYKLESLPTGYAALKNTTVTDNDLTGIVKAIIPATGSDPDTILVKMTTGQSGGSTPGTNTAQPKLFAPGATLVTESLGNLEIKSTSDAVAKGSLVEVPQFDTYAAGHLIQVDAQSMVIDKYSARPTVNIGFIVKEEIVTTSDNVALYDNAGATPNLTSPGADRLKITLELAKSTDVLPGETFFEVYKVVNGQVTLTRTKDKILSKLGNIIHDRLSAVNGDFVERNDRGAFVLDITDDSAGAAGATLVARVSSGTAFIGGIKIDQDFGRSLTITKPRSLTTDVTTRTNEFLSARYGNYFLCDSAYGLISSISTLDSIDVFSGANLGGNRVGSARIRHVDEYNDNYRIHVFDVDVTGSFANVRSIGIDSENYANLTTVTGKYDLFDRSENNLLFTLPEQTVQEISSVTMAVGKIYTDTTSAGGVAQISTGSSNTFADTEQWIVSDDTTGDLYTEVTISSGGNGSTSADISGLPTLTAVSVLGYENVTATLKTKSLKPSTTTWESEQVSLSGGVFTLSKADIYLFDRIIDDATNEDIIRKFNLDNGQRDNYYGPGKGTLKSGAAAPTGTITVYYRYFQHSNPGSGTGYFGGKASYPDVEYEDVPRFTSVTGRTYRLADVIDMRPVKNPSNETFSGGISRVEPLPRNGDTITVGTAKYWNARVDAISLSRQGQLVHHVGKSNINPDAPVIPGEHLPLHYVYLNPYTFTKNDLRIQQINNVGYKMSDIRRLERRVDNLEKMATLTMTEQNLSQLQVFDPTTGSSLRQTQGLSGDGFLNLVQSNIFDDDYRARAERGFLQPLYYTRSLGLTYDSDLSENTVIKGTTVWPTYTEEVMFAQDQATASENVNQFEIAQSIATGKLVPQMDTWTNRRKVDQSYAVPSNTSIVQEKLDEITSQSLDVGNSRNPDRPAPRLSDTYGPTYGR